MERNTFTFIYQPFKMNCLRSFEEPGHVNLLKPSDFFTFHQV